MTPQSFDAVGQTTTNRPPMPKSYTVESILVLLLCCLPLGIVGLIKGQSVSRLYHSGEYDKSLAASASTKTWLISGVIVGLFLYILYAGFAIYGYSLSEENNSLRNQLYEVTGSRTPEYTPLQPGDADYVDVNSLENYEAEVVEEPIQLVEEDNTY